LVTLIAGLVWSWASAQQRVGKVLIEGCKVTNPDLVLEAAGIGEGMEFDEQKIRQALLDLGLFTSVTINSQPYPDDAVAVTIVVSEKELPTPKTVAAAKALNLTALAERCWEKETEDFGASYLKGSLSLRFPLSSDLLQWKPTSKAPWAKKFVQWQSSCDKRLGESLRKELENFLRRHPKDVEARLALALLMAETDEVEQLKRALSEFQRLLTYRPNLHWAYSLRLSAVMSRPFFLPLRLPESSVHISVSATGEFAKIKIEPSELTWLRGELLLAIEEGERHFRTLPPNRWDREAIKAAVKFFQNATAAIFLLTLSRSVEEVAEQFGEEFVPPERLYFNDFLRISQIAQRFPNDAEVQLAMVMWGLNFLGGLFMTPAVGTLGEDEDDEQKLSRFGEAFLTYRNLYKPMLERWSWHLRRVIALDKKWASTAFALLAFYHGVMGDFNAARRTVENALSQPQTDGKTPLSVISNLAFLEAATAAANRPTEEEDIIAAIMKRCKGWLSQLRAAHPLVPELTFLWAVLRLSEYRPSGQELEWASAPEPVRKEVLKTLKEAAERNPRSDFAQRVFGLTLIMEGEFERALPYLRKAHELNPKWFPNRYALALGYLATGETEKALHLFRSAGNF